MGNCYIRSPYRSATTLLQVSGRSGPRPLNLMIYQSNDIGWKVGRVGNDRRGKRDRRERRFQRRFNRDEKITAFRRDLPPARLP